MDTKLGNCLSKKNCQLFIDCIIIKYYLCLLKFIRIKYQSLGGNNLATLKTWINDYDNYNNKIQIHLLYNVMHTD